MSQDSRDIDLDSEVHDAEDPDVFEGSDEMPSMEDSFPEEPEMNNVPPPMDSMEDLQPTGLENEFKTVPGVQAPEPEDMYPPPPQPQDDGVLFGDAPEYRAKKTAYN